MPCTSSPSTKQSYEGSTISCHLRQAAALSSGLSPSRSYGRSWRKAARTVWSSALKCGPARAGPQGVGGRGSARPPKAPPDGRRLSRRVEWAPGGWGAPPPTRCPLPWVTCRPTRVATRGAATTTPGPPVLSIITRSPLQPVLGGQVRRETRYPSSPPRPPPSAPAAAGLRPRGKRRNSGGRGTAAECRAVQQESSRRWEWCGVLGRWSGQGRGRQLTIRALEPGRADHGRGGARRSKRGFRRRLEVRGTHRAPTPGLVSPALFHGECPTQTSVV